MIPTIPEIPAALQLADELASPFVDDFHEVCEAAALELRCLHAENCTLASIIHQLEVSANTVAYCYTYRPENFAMALRELEQGAETARAMLAARSTEKS